MPWGKHKGQELRDIPQDYLLWVLRKADKCDPYLKRAIEQRLGFVDPPPPPPPTQTTTNGVTVEQIIRAWHRAMTKKYHPDRGGTHEQMLVVNEGAELLRKLSGET